MLFVRSASGALGMLLKQLDETIAKNKAVDLRSFAVFPTSDYKAAETKLKEFAEKARISDRVPLVVPDDLAKLKSYNIHPDAEVTVVLFRKWSVRDNFAFKTGEFKEKDVQAIMAAFAKIIPTKEELEQEAKEEREAQQKKKLEAAKKEAEQKKKAEATKTGAKK